jgi:hypothetical protein
MGLLGGSKGGEKYQSLPLRVCHVAALLYQVLGRKDTMGQKARQTGLATVLLCRYNALCLTSIML